MQLLAIDGVMVIVDCGGARWMAGGAWTLPVAKLTWNAV